MWPILELTVNDLRKVAAEQWHWRKPAVELSFSSYYYFLNQGCEEAELLVYLTFTGVVGQAQTYVGGVRPYARSDGYAIQRIVSYVRRSNRRVGLAIAGFYALDVAGLHAQAMAWRGRFQARDTSRCCDQSYCCCCYQGIEESICLR